jgi:hypothetical protein
MWYFCRSLVAKISRELRPNTAMTVARDQLDQRLRDRLDARLAGALDLANRGGARCDRVED